jgi:hypothetical protein
MRTLLGMFLNAGDRAWRFFGFFLAGCSSMWAASTLTVSEVERSSSTQGSFLVVLNTTDNPTALELDLVYDAAEVEVSAPGSLQIPDGDPEDFEVVSNEKASGRMRVVLSSRKLAPLKDGTVFRVPVRVAQSASTIENTLPVLVSNIEVCDARAERSGVKLGATATVRIKGVKRDKPVYGTNGKAPALELDLGLIKDDSVRVAAVEFFVNGVALPKQQGVTWTPPGSGPFELKAKATMEDGSLVWSSTVPVLITGVNTRPVRASYAGVVRDREGAKSAGATGAIVFATTAVGSLGSYSVKLNLGGRSFSAAGKIKVGSTENVKVGGRYTLYFQQEAVGVSDKIRGLVTDGTVNALGEPGGGTFVGTFEANRNVWVKGRAESTDFAGRYTVVLPLATNLASIPAPVPVEGVAVIGVSSLGMAQGVFSFWDGTRSTQSGWISKDAVWPVYSSIQKGAGFLAGELDFSAAGKAGNVGGAVDWRVGPSGLHELAPRGGRFVTPSGQLLLPVKREPGNLHVKFTGGGLASQASETVTLGEGGAVAYPLSNPRRLSLRMDPVAGGFAGGYTFDGDKQSSPFFGVLLQGETAGDFETGFFSRTRVFQSGKYMEGGTLRLEVAR